MVATLDPLLRYASSGSPASRGADIGALYKAQRQPDGNWTVKGVEIFNACERSNPGTGHVDKFDEEWLQAAVVNFDERKSRRGYLPPVHLDHHTPDGVSQPFAGHIGRMWVAPNSDNVPSLFADLVDVPPEIYAKMAAKRLPFRSIEVNKPESKEVSSLALMATKVPFHKLPLLRVVDESGSQRQLNFEEAEIHYGTPDPDTNARFAIVQRFEGEHVAPLAEPTRAMQRFYGNQQYYDSDGYSPDDHQALMALLGQMPQDDYGAGDEEMAEEMAEDEGEENPGAPDDAYEGGDESLPGDPGMGAGAGVDAGAAPMAPAAPDPITMISQLQQQVQALTEQVGTVQQMITSLNQGTAEAQIRPASPPPSVSAEPTEEAAHFEDAAVTTDQKQPAKTAPKPATKQPASPAAPAAPARPAAQQSVTLTPVQFEALTQRLDAQDARIKELVAFKEAIEFAQVQDEVWSEVDMAVRGHIAKLGEDKFSQEQQKAAYRTVMKFLESDVNAALSGSMKFEELPGVIGNHVAEWRSMTKPDTTAVKPPPAQAGSAAPRSDAAAKPDELKQRAQAFLEASKTHGAAPVLQKAFKENPVQFAEAIATFEEEWSRQPSHVKAFNDNDPTTYVRKRMVTLHSQPV